MAIDILGNGSGTWILICPCFVMAVGYVTVCEALCCGNAATWHMRGSRIDIEACTSAGVHMYHDTMRHLALWI